MHTDPTPYAGLLDALKDDRGMPLADAVKAFGQDLVDDALNDDVVIVEWDALWACNVVKGGVELMPRRWSIPTYVQTSYVRGDWMVWGHDGRCFSFVSKAQALAWIDAQMM